MTTFMKIILVSAILLTIWGGIIGSTARAHVNYKGTQDYYVCGGYDGHIVEVRGASSEWQVSRLLKEGWVLYPGSAGDGSSITLTFVKCSSDHEVEE